VRFGGHLLGGHIPPGGKLVELQALVSRGWRTFATVRTDRHGDLSYAHRFALISRGRSFRFRLLVRRAADYPFERGTSRSISVRVQ
jgi:hypothetical protein